MELFILIFWFLFSFAPAELARRKGRSGLLWFFFSLIISPVLGLIFILVASDLTRGRCPVCSEAIPKTAQLCPHCRSALRPTVAHVDRPPVRATILNRRDYVLMAIVLILAILTVIGYMGRSQQSDERPREATTARARSAPTQEKAPPARVVLDTGQGGTRRSDQERGQAGSCWTRGTLDTQEEKRFDLTEAERNVALRSPVTASPMDLTGMVYVVMPSGNVKRGADREVILIEATKHFTAQWQILGSDFQRAWDDALAAYQQTQTGAPSFEALRRMEDVRKEYAARALELIVASETRTVRTNVDGRYEIQGISLGTYYVFAFTGGLFWMVPIEITRQSHALDLTNSNSGWPFDKGRQASR